MPIVTPSFCTTYERGREESVATTQRVVDRGAQRDNERADLFRSGVDVDDGHTVKGGGEADGAAAGDRGARCRRARGGIKPLHGP
jgi:hypothetical protein